MADDSTTTLADALQFFADRAEDAEDQYRETEGSDVPDHGEALVVDEAAKLVKTGTSVDMAFEMADDEDDVAVEEMEDDLLECIVDLFEAVGVVQYERDLDIATAVEERIEYVEQYMAFADAIEAAETEEEEMAAIDEHMTEQLEEDLMGNSIDIGDNVDADEYSHDDAGRGFQ